jgi:ribosomal protein S3
MLESSLLKILLKTQLLVQKLCRSIRKKRTPFRRAVKQTIKKVQRTTMKRSKGSGFRSFKWN